MVEFHDTDMAGVVHFSRYFLWMEVAEHAFWREQGIPIVSQPGVPGYFWPRIACSFQYHQAAYFGDEVTVCLDISKIGKTSLSFRCEIFRGDQKIATGETTCVCSKVHSPGIFEKVEIPPGLRAKLDALPRISPA